VLSVTISPTAAPPGASQGKYLYFVFFTLGWRKSGKLP
jgi:hypothetical protein